MAPSQTIVPQAAQAGQGAALGRIALLDELLNNGQLALATDVPLENAHGYFLVRQQKVRHSTRTSNAGTGHWNNAGGRCCQRSL